MIVDFHVHMYPDRVAKMITRRLGKNANLTAICDGAVGDTLPLMAAAGITHLVQLPVATGPNFQAGNDFSLECSRHYPQAVIPFGSVFPGDESIEAQLEAMAEQGIRGINIHPQSQACPIDDPRYLRILRRAAALGLPVIFHAGKDPSAPTGPWYAMPRQIRNLLAQLDDLPELVLIGAHMGGFDCFDEAEQLLMGENIWLDTAGIYDRLPDEQLLRMIEKHGADRILFGSDCPWERPKDAVAQINTLGLCESDRAAIFSGNACRLLHLD